ncbi:MAG: hypothetical protein HQK54_13665 [Oligoflexales bacterium]|nr:hypothetical protein [Oligoflexales bacterium]
MEIEKMRSSFLEMLRKAGSELSDLGYLNEDTIKSLNLPLYNYLGMTRQQAVDKHMDIIKQGFSKHKIEF